MFSNKLIPVIALFVFTNTIVLFTEQFGHLTGLKFNFILVVNAMLFGMSFFNHYRLTQLSATNAHAMVRSVMLGTLLKMIVFAGSALVYATQKKGPVGVLTLLICMGLYLIYTLLEIQWVVKKKG
jgi:hypothetical protein